MGGGSPSTTTTSTLTKQQKGVSKDLAAYFGERTGEGLPLYEGPLYAPLSAEQIGTLQKYGSFAEQIGALQGQGQAAFQAGLGGPSQTLSQGEMNNFFTQLEAPSRRTFEEQTIPGIREAYAGPGTYWGGARAHAETGARTAFEENLTAQRAAMSLEARSQQAQLEEAAKQRQLAGGAQAQGLYQSALGGEVQAQEAQRQTQIQEWQVEYQQWMQSLPEMSPVIQQQLAYLNTPMVAVAAQPGPGVFDWVSMGLDFAGNFAPGGGAASA